MFLSSIVTVVELIVVVVPLTIKFPTTAKSLLIVVVPVLAPILTFVAAPAKFIVVAVVLNSACDPTYPTIDDEFIVVVPPTGDPM